MNSFPLADLLIFGVIAVCGCMAMMRGMIAEIGTLVSWVVAFALAKAFAVPFSQIALSSVTPQVLSVAMAFVVLFVLTRVALRFVQWMLTSAVSAVGLGCINSVLGGLLGLVKGVLLVTMAVMVCAYTGLSQTDGWKASYSIPYFEFLAQEVLMPNLPENPSHDSDDVP